ncbi:MAG: hypothetical protein JNN07_17245 [Verrucomicrobiales bacterium]|nr:hypothetical protein [Verrucomicrobiales bacterium]
MSDLDSKPAILLPSNRSGSSAEGGAAGKAEEGNQRDPLSSVGAPLPRGGRVKSAAAQRWHRRRILQKYFQRACVVVSVLTVGVTLVLLFASRSRVGSSRVVPQVIDPQSLLQDIRP